jgi:pyrimidine operon attenuation protein/uracil phosphoribosyltransferase
MTSLPTQVLDHQEVFHKINRIAWQIYEEHHKHKSIILAGIAVRGYALAALLAVELKKIGELDVLLAKIELDKTNPLNSTAKVSGAGKDFTNKSIVVIDDVLNSGSTLIYGVRFFLDFKVQSIHTVVLVDRSHKRYPVKADFKGLSLSTAMQEHVEVHIESEPYSVSVS